MTVGAGTRCATQAVEPTTGSFLATVAGVPRERSEAEDDDVEVVEIDAGAGYLERMAGSGVCMVGIAGAEAVR